MLRQYFNDFEENLHLFIYLFCRGKLLTVLLLGQFEEEQQRRRIKQMNNSY